MGLTTATYTGLSGLNVNQTRIETIGHNIANVNTHAFKGSRTLFQTQFAQTLSMGTPPSDTSGGTNPMQIGLGALVGATQRMSTPGSLETTGIPSDLAVDGAGYFIVRDAAGRQYYTRDGAFSLNAENQLVNASGHLVQGFGADENFTIVPGTLQDLRIPLGNVSIARATESVSVDGDLSAADTERQAPPAVVGAVRVATSAEDAAEFAEPELAREDQAGATGIDLLDDVQLDVKIELGRTSMYIEDVLRLGPGAVVELDKLAGDPVDIYVNDRLIARGEVLVLNESFCVRINDIHSPIPEVENG